MLPLSEVEPAITQLPMVTPSATAGKDYQRNTNRRGLMNPWHDAACFPIRMREVSVRQKCFSSHGPTMDSTLLMLTGTFSLTEAGGASSSFTVLSLITVQSSRMPQYDQKAIKIY